MVGNGDIKISGIRWLREVTIFRLWVHQEFTLCHVVGCTVGMLFLLAAACFRWMLANYLFLCVFIAGDPLPVPSLREKTSSFSGTSQATFFLQGSVKQTDRITEW